MHSRSGVEPRPKGVERCMADAVSTHVCCSTQLILRRKQQLLNFSSKVRCAWVCLGYKAYEFHVELAVRLRVIRRSSGHQFCLKVLPLSFAFCGGNGTCGRMRFGRVATSDTSIFHIPLKPIDIPCSRHRPEVSNRIFIFIDQLSTPV